MLLPTRADRERASQGRLVHRPSLRQAPDLQALHQELQREGRVHHPSRRAEGRQRHLRAAGGHQHRAAGRAGRRAARDGVQHRRRGPPAEELQVRDHRARGGPRRRWDLHGGVGIVRGGCAGREHGGGHAPLRRHRREAESAETGFRRRG